MGDWGDLPRDVLESICGRLNQLSDIHRFGLVCVSWRSVAVDSCVPPLLPKYFPKLVIPGETQLCIQASIGDDGYFKFEKMNDENLQKLLPLPHDYHCCGSSLGWLVLIDDSFNMQLFNPLSGVQFELPSFTTLPDLEYVDDKRVHKAVISQDPMSYSTSSNTIVFVLIIYGGSFSRLGLCKLGDEVWTPIKTYNYFDDVIYYQQRFYCLQKSGECDVVNLYEGGLFTIERHVRRGFGDYERSYLVESKGKLFGVQMVISFDSPQNEGSHSSSDDNEDISGGRKDYYRTVWFRVYKLSYRRWEWKEVEDIGDRAFFVGFNTSFSLNASHYMGFCKPNSIYFTDDMYPFKEGEEPYVHDIGIFNLKDRSVDTIFSVDSSSMRLPSFWFTPC